MLNSLQIKVLPLQKTEQMETMIVRFDGNNRAVKQVLNGLRKMGAIAIEKSQYDEAFVRKIAKGEHDLRTGKGVVVNLDELWK